MSANQHSLVGSTLIIEVPLRQQDIVDFSQKYSIDMKDITSEILIEKVLGEMSSPEAPVTVKMVSSLVEPGCGKIASV